VPVDCTRHTGHGGPASRSLLIAHRCPGMRCRRRRPRLGMGWLRSVLSPLRRLWCRANAVQRKSTLPFVDAWLCSSFFLSSALNGEPFFFLVFVCRERDLHPVRRRQVVPMRGRARALVDPRGIPRPATADPDADPAVVGPEAVTRGDGGYGAPAGSGTAPPE
jgi:hypothetical protein